jgi:hypothetical protein
MHHARLGGCDGCDGCQFGVQRAHTQPRMAQELNAQNSFDRAFEILLTSDQAFTSDFRIRCPSCHAASIEL